MRRREPTDDARDQNSPARGKFGSLFFFQNDSRRTYFRLTTLGAVLLFLLIVIPAIAILTLFYINSLSRESETDVNIHSPSTTFSPTAPPIRMPSVPPPPTVKQPRYVMPDPLATPTPNKSANKQVAPRQTPQPSPSESPP